MGGGGLSEWVTRADSQAEGNLASECQVRASGVDAQWCQSLELGLISFLCGVILEPSSCGTRLETSRQRASTVGSCKPGRGQQLSSCGACFFKKPLVSYSQAAGGRLTR